MHEEILTKQEAERLVANVHERSLDCPLYYQSFYDSIEDEAAEILGKCNVISIPLNGLTELSDAAAASLGQHEGGFISLNGLTELSDAAANSLGQHERILALNGLTSLSDAAAESLSKHGGCLYLTLDNLTASAAQILRDAGHGE